MNKKLKYILIAMAIIASGMLIWYLSTIFIYLIISSVLSLIARPLVVRIGRIKIGKKRIGSGIAAGITLLTIWFVLIVFFIVFIPLVVKEGQALSQVNTTEVVENLQEPIQALEKYYNDFGTSQNREPLRVVAGKQLKQFLNVSNITTILSTITGALGNIFIAMFSISFITFFFLKEKNIITRIILIAVPAKWDSSALHAILSIKKLLSRYFIGLLLQLTAIFAGVSIGLSIIGIDFSHVLIIALFAAVINVIPYIGPLIGYVFAITVGIIVHLHLSFYSELLPLLGYMTIVFAIVQLADNFLFQPIIFSNSVKAHPLEIFLVILIAGTLAGIVGMIVAIPVYTILRVIAKEFFSGYRIIKKLTSQI